MLSYTFLCATSNTILFLIKILTIILIISISKYPSLALCVSTPILLENLIMRILTVPIILIKHAPLHAKPALTTAHKPLIIWSVSRRANIRLLEDIGKDIPFFLWLLR